MSRKNTSEELDGEARVSQRGKIEADMDVQRPKDRRLPQRGLMATVLGMEGMGKLELSCSEEQKVFCAQRKRMEMQ